MPGDGLETWNPPVESLRWSNWRLRPPDRGNTVHYPHGFYAYRADALQQVDYPLLVVGEADGKNIMRKRKPFGTQQGGKKRMKRLGVG